MCTVLHFSFLVAQEKKKGVLASDPGHMGMRLGGMHTARVGKLNGSLGTKLSGSSCCFY